MVPETNTSDYNHRNFKSWGEEQIGRLLERNNISYQYEYPLAILKRGNVRLYYPDFRLPQHGGILIEYLGREGDPAYDGSAERKIQTYHDAGIDCLFLTRDSLRGNWPDDILGRIEDILKGRLERFYRH